MLIRESVQNSWDARRGPNIRYAIDSFSLSAAQRQAYSAFFQNQPPAGAYASTSKVVEQIESIERPAFYFDLLAYRRVLGEPDTPYTPAIPLVLALAETVRLIRAEGIEQVWARARMLARATRAGLEALGMKLVASRPAWRRSRRGWPSRCPGRWSTST